MWASGEFGSRKLSWTVGIVENAFAAYFPLEQQRLGKGAALCNAHFILPTFSWVLAGGQQFQGSAACQRPPNAPKGPRERRPEWGQQVRLTPVDFLGLGLTLSEPQFLHLSSGE